MRASRLLRSATLRLTIVYLLTFALLSAGLLTFVYRESIAYIHQQTDETIAAEITGLSEQYAQGGILGLRNTISQRLRSPERDRESIYLLVDWTGRRLAGNLKSWPDAHQTSDGKMFFELRSRDGKRVRAVGLSFQVQGVAQLLVGRSIEDRVRLEESLRGKIIQSAGFMLLIAVIVAFLVARWTTSRLEAVNKAAREIMAGDLGRRIEMHGGGDEFDELSANLNAMLSRIESLISGMREVTDNIAHDLRTPLSRMRMRLELALAEEPSDPKTRELITTTIADAEGLIGTFNALLSIARADAGERRAEWERLDLSTLVDDIYELFEPLADERGIKLEVQVEKEAMVAGSRQLLSQAIANLVDNAIKYSPVDGHVLIACKRASNTGKVRHPAMIEVRDNGPGIAPGLREKALERFARLEPERSTPGNGLGLSLVKAVSKLHDAELTLEDAKTDPPKGLCVRLTFPLS